MSWLGREDILSSIRHQPLFYLLQVLRMQSGQSLFKDIRISKKDGLQKREFQLSIVLIISGSLNHQMQTKAKELKSLVILMNLLHLSIRDHNSHAVLFKNILKGLFSLKEESSILECGHCSIIRMKFICTSMDTLELHLMTITFRMETTMCT